MLQPMMAPGTTLSLDEGDGNRVVVHIGPESFSPKRELDIRHGKWVKIRGAWADIGKETVFIAAKKKTTAIVIRCVSPVTARRSELCRQSSWRTSGKIRKNAISPQR